MAFKHVYEENKRREENYAASLRQNALNPCCYNCRYYRKVSSTFGMCIEQRFLRDVVYKVGPDQVCDKFAPNTSSSPLLW